MVIQSAQIDCMIAREISHRPRRRATRARARASSGGFNSPPTRSMQSILHGPHTICLLTDFGILNSIACRILNSDQFLNWILTENELDSRVHIYYPEKVVPYGRTPVVFTFQESHQL